jgi:long-chain acyl-CoA synthetase
VFPEGRHTKDGKLLPFRAGIGMLVNNLRIPVLPMRIHGLFELKQAGKRIAKPHAITIHIGKPVEFDANTAPQGIADDLRRRVEEL